jgi:hypothetical protein
MEHQRIGAPVYTAAASSLGFVLIAILRAADDDFWSAQPIYTDDPKNAYSLGRVNTLF